jgi:hypothetical protein
MCMYLFTHTSIYIHIYIYLILGEYKRLVTGLIEKTEKSSMKNSENMDEFSEVDKSAVVNEQIKRLNELHSLASEIGKIPGNFYIYTYIYIYIYIYVYTYIYIYIYIYICIYICIYNSLKIPGADGAAVDMNLVWDEDQNGEIESKKLLKLTSEKNNMTVKHNDNGLQSKNKYPLIELSKFEQNAFIQGNLSYEYVICMFIYT